MQALTLWRVETEDGVGTEQVWGGKRRSMDITRRVKTSNIKMGWMERDLFVYSYPLILNMNCGEIRVFKMNYGVR